MNNEEIKYKNILDILKRSGPSLSNTYELEERILNSIIQKQKKGKRSFNFLDFIFGWVYVGWVRTVLVTASVILIVTFAYQQTIILKRINSIDRRAIFSENQTVTGPQDNSGRTLFFRLSGRKLPSQGITVSEKQLNQIMNSYNELEGKYRDLIKLIEEDPELKNYIEKKLSEKNRKKLNL